MFEIAGPIYDDPRLPFVLGSDIVLEALLASLALHRPVRFGSHIIWVPDESGMIGVSAVQFFELRTPDQEVIRHVGARSHC